LLLRNVKNEKHISSSTFLKTWTMAIFANLRYLGNSGSMVALELFFIHNLNITCCASGPQQSNSGVANELEPPNPKSFGS
jgi:hypothetical protein